MNASLVVDVVDYCYKCVFSVALETVSSVISCSTQDRKGTGSIMNWINSANG